MQKDTIVKLFSIVQGRKRLEGICMQLENHFFPKWIQQKAILLNRKPFKKRNIETQILDFFSNPVSGKSHCAKNFRGEPLGGFYHPFCCKVSKKSRGPFDIEKFSKKSHKAGKEKSHGVEIVEKVTILHWKGFAFHVRGFGCVQNEVLCTYGKSS